MEILKMNKNEKIEMCFDFIETHECIENAMETSASGSSQARANIKQNMKRNKTVIFNAMVDGMCMLINDKQKAFKNNFKQ